MLLEQAADDDESLTHILSSKKQHRTEGYAVPSRPDGMTCELHQFTKPATILAAAVILGEWNTDTNTMLLE
jgi:hypothetical protein